MLNLRKFVFLRQLKTGLLYILQYMGLRKTNYAPLKASQDLNSYTEAWRDQKIPLMQRSVVAPQLQAFAAGESVPVFDAFIDAIQSIYDQLPQAPTLLEIGCSSGYYSEVLQKSKFPLTYTGCDYSDSFIQMAKEMYPLCRFDVADATALPYEKNAFDVVVSGCCLLHITEYQKAIEEATRVAKSFVIFHRTPIRPQGSTQYFTKTAYGIQTIEIHFSEDELYNLFEKNGLILRKRISLGPLSTDVTLDLRESVTYVCEKSGPK